MVAAGRGSSWRAATEPTMEDMRRQRLLISSFDGLVQKLKAGKKEHEFVQCLSDIELFCELKPHDVPETAQKLLVDARDSLLRNARRGQFWRRKAVMAFKNCMARVPVKMKLEDFAEPAVPSANESGGDEEDEEEEDEGSGAGARPGRRKRGVGERVEAPASEDAPPAVIAEGTGGADEPDAGAYPEAYTEGAEPVAAGEEAYTEGAEPVAAGE